MNIKEKAANLKSVSPFLAAASAEVRNKALESTVRALEENKAEIIAENEKDMAAAKERNLTAPVVSRLKFDEAKIEDAVAGINELIGLPDPLGRIQLKRELDDGLVLVRESCPIGVIGVIFEARPDAMVQIAALCMKSGNCAVLKGGSEAKLTNRKLFSVIRDAVAGAGLPEGCMTLAETHDDIDDLLGCGESVDLLIPRGSNEFVQHIMNNTRIPVMGHADGICHIYVDKAADLDKAVSIIVDAKTQYAAVCNAVETLLVHRDIAGRLMPVLAGAFGEKGVTIRGTEEVQAIINCERADEADFATEYLDYIISVKIVGSIDEAIDHINKYGSHHTDAIVTEDSGAAAEFRQLVESAGVYQNCSTRFADGFRYGFGAEVGVSTGKLHARGPVGLEGLTTYKYKLFGNGHVVADYAEGRRKFHFKDLKF